MQQVQVNFMARRLWLTSEFYLRKFPQAGSGKRFMAAHFQLLLQRGHKRRL